MLPYTPMTELSAVNQILAAVGEPPVSTLVSSGISSASLARDYLIDASRDVQSLGLNYNSENNFTLLADVNGFVYLPANALKADPSDRSKNYVWRGNPPKLYDKEKHTFTIGEPVNVDIVFFFPFDELPQSVRKYITIKAARRFQARWLSSDILHKLTEQDEQEAWYIVFDDELLSSDCSIFNDPETNHIVSRYW